MTRRTWMAAATLLLLTVAAPAASAAGGTAGGGRACVADRSACVATDHPSACWHGGRDDGAVCVSPLP